MPIAVTVRRDFSSSVFRDAFIRALSAPGITSAYIASGFFSDFTAMLDSRSPDFSITEGMEGKKLFLFGGYDRKKAASDLKSLTSNLHTKKLEVYTYLPKFPDRNDKMERKWHAKLAAFLSDTEPVLAVSGSSNFTAPSMFGPSEERFFTDIPRIHVEADTFYWKKGNLDSGQAMHDALYYWGKNDSTEIAFDDERYDDEVAKLIEHIYQSILVANWERLL